MVESLRTRQKRMANETIVLALAEHVAETGSLDFSIAEVAKRAGVSHRTVYNHFGDRQGLIDALSEYFLREMDQRGGTDIPETLAELPGVVAPNFRAMTAVAPLTEAFASLDHVRATDAGHTERTRRIAEIVSRGFPGLSDREVVAVAALVRQVVSSQQWYRLTREHGLTTDEAAAVVAWTLRLQVDALERGDRPFEEGMK